MHNLTIIFIATLQTLFILQTETLHPLHDNSLFSPSPLPDPSNHYCIHCFCEFDYFIFFFLAPSLGLWDLNPLTRNQTQALSSGSTES